ncbi:MAG: hypothetical protein COA79_23930 [Planctomycetota bacterium]|nr:MAG: hypothetical protein COA79_23930 [Planctomycetota bacterium]
MSRQSYLSTNSSNPHDQFPFLIHRTGQVSKVHCHDHDFWELVYVRSGTGICINGDDKFNFRSHQIILTQPFVRHEFQSNGMQSHEQISLSIYPDFLVQPEIAKVQVGELLAQLENSKKLVFNVPERDIALVEQSLEVISQEFLFKRVDFESIISLEIARLLITLNRIVCNEQMAFPQFNGLPHLIHEAIKLIEMRFHDIRDIADMLEGIHIVINSRYFIRLFKEHVGYTPIQYLNRVRIEKSCSLLIYTSLPILGVALDTGFRDLRFFNRQFKRFIGVTPKIFRESAKNDSKLSFKLNRFNFKD